MTTPEPASAEEAAFHRRIQIILGASSSMCVADFAAFVLWKWAAPWMSDVAIAVGAVAFVVMLAAIVGGLRIVMRSVRRERDAR